MFVMEHVSQIELAHRLQAAADLVVVGARYAHYKHPEQSYVVTGLAVREDTQEVSVIYTAEYDECIPFIRTLDSFIGSVEQNGVSVPRFRKLD